MMQNEKELYTWIYISLVICFAKDFQK